MRISSHRPRPGGTRRSRPGRNGPRGRYRRAAIIGIAALGITGLGFGYAGFAVAGSPHPPSPGRPALHSSSSELKAFAAHASAVGSGGASVRRACPVPTRPGTAECLSLVRTNVKHHLGVSPAVAPSGYGPSDLQSAYKLPSSSAGSGQTVAVVDAYNDPSAESDLAAYRSQYGLPACTSASGCFSKVNENGQASPLPLAAPTTGNDAGWAIEESTDLDTVSAICPNCRIVLVEATAPNLGDLATGVNAAVQLGAEYVSNSYGGAEDPSETVADAYYNHPGVVVTAASGDSGYGPQYPAASRDVVSVGGTKLTPNSSTSRGWSETVWNETATGYGATGSGCSADESKPSWQHDTGCGHRTQNDVAADADPLTGVAVYDSYDPTFGGWNVVGGTSVASPLVASAYALAGPPAAGTYPASYPYVHHTALNDVTSGNDGSCSPAYLCTAGTGYDGPTGWGTPEGVGAFSSSGAPQPVTGMVTSGVTGQCLDDKSDSAADGNKIDIWNCNGSAAQNWTVGTDGTVQINGKCLDVSGQGTGNGTKVDLYDCVGQANQQWTVGANGHLVGLQSGKCLDDPGFSTANGTQLDIWSCVNQGNEAWYPPPASAATGPVTSAVGGKCLDDSGGSAANGNKIDIYTCDGTAAQNWTVQPDGTIQVNGKCLDVYQNGYANGSKIDLYTCVSGAMNQQWRSQAGGNLVSLASGKCLDDPGYSTADGTQVDIWSCVSQANESWTLP